MYHSSLAGSRHPLDTAVSEFGHEDTMESCVPRIREFICPVTKPSSLQFQPITSTLGSWVNTVWFSEHRSVGTL
jgi:hypothetical protein